MVILVVFNSLNVVKNVEKARPRCAPKAPVLHYYGHVTSRYQQKMYMVIFKSRHALEQYPKIKLRVRQSVRWLEHIPYLTEIENQQKLVFKSASQFSCSREVAIINAQV